MKKQKGITLIALIITIIVMLILVAVTLSITIGDNGILEKTIQATSEQEEQQERETLMNFVMASMTESENSEVDYTKLATNAVNGGWETIDSEKTKYSKDSLDYAFLVKQNGEIVKVEKKKDDDQIPDGLVDYLLGTNHEGRNLKDINEWDWGKKTFEFFQEGDFSSTNVSLVMDIYGFPIEFETTGYYDKNEGKQIYEKMMYCTYNGTIYRFLVKNISNEKYYTAPIDSNTTIAVAYEEDSTSNVGKYVNGIRMTMEL